MAEPPGLEHVEQTAHGAERLHRMIHIVDSFEDGHQVILSGKGGVARIPNLEVDAIIQTISPRVFTSAFDRGLVQVEAIYMDLRIASCHSHARPPVAAPKVGDAGRRRGLQTGMHILDGRQPLKWQLVPESGIVERGLTLA